MNRQRYDQERLDLNDPAKPAWLPEGVGNMTKWEYHSVTLDPTDHGYIDELNKLGEDGWELTSRGPVESERTYLGSGGYSHSQEHLFKRPYQMKDNSKGRECRGRCGDPTRCGGC